METRLTWSITGCCNWTKRQRRRRQEVVAGCWRGMFYNDLSRKQTYLRDATINYYRARNRTGSSLPVQSLLVSPPLNVFMQMTAPISWDLTRQPSQQDVHVAQWEHVNEWGRTVVRTAAVPNRVIGCRRRRHAGFIIWTQEAFWLHVH